MASTENRTVSREDEITEVRVLVVHPLRVERVRVLRPLRAHYGRNIDAREAADADEALDWLKQQAFDVAVVGHDLNGQQGLDLAARFAELAPDMATLLIADEDTTAIAAQVAQSAACDYLVRGQLDECRLSHAISAAIRQIHLQRDYRETVRRMRETHDQMDHLVRALSHDMNANFMLMEGSFSKLQRSLEEECPHRPDLPEVASHVRACMAESRRFLNDLVGLARTGRVEMDPELTDTEEVVEEVLFEQRELFRQRGVTVDAHVPLPPLWCNRHRLKQVLTNLIWNAVKHGTDPEDPRITIEGTIGEEARAMTASLRIHDNGPGIPEEWQQEIFMPGRRAPDAGPEGSGMGLAIVRKIIQHYGGTIQVDSGPGRGTTFEIELPSVAHAKERPEAAPSFTDSDPRPADHRLDLGSSDDDPRLHPHQTNSRRGEPGRQF